MAVAVHRTWVGAVLAALAVVGAMATAAPAQQATANTADDQLVQLARQLAGEAARDAAAEPAAPAAPAAAPHAEPTLPAAPALPPPTRGEGRGEGASLPVPATPATPVTAAAAPVAPVVPAPAAVTPAAPVDPAVPHAAQAAGVIPMAPSPPSLPAGGEGSPIIAPAHEQLPLLPRSNGAGGATNADTSLSSLGGNWVLSTATALGVVLILVFALKAIVQKTGGKAFVHGNSPVVEVLSRSNLAPKCQGILVRLGHRVVLVGHSPAGLTTLTEVTDPDEVAALLKAVSAASPQSISRSFTQMLGRFQGEHEEADDSLLDRDEHRVDRTRDRVSSLLSRVRSAAAREARS